MMLSLQDAILQTVTYADIFDYPLTAREIHRYLTGVGASLEAVQAALPGVLHCVGEYYTLPGRETIVATRLRRREIAVRLWPRAVFFGKLIAALPFVRMVVVTGSLAMDNVEADADLDYLVVTAPGRLWLCRAMILGLGRLAGLQGLRLCPNYMITWDVFFVATRNLYVAHELTQMIPLTGLDIYTEMRRLNDWTNDFLPNAGGAPLGADSTSPQPAPVLWAQARLEALLRIPLVDWLERWEMERKIRKLRRENGDNPEAEFSADLCKGHFNRHGQKTEQTLRRRLEDVLPKSAP